MALGDTIEAKIQTYLYGDGETVRADEEDLAFFREHFDELNASDALDCISDHRLSLNRTSWILGTVKKAKMKKIGTIRHGSAEKQGLFLWQRKRGR